MATATGGDPRPGRALIEAALDAGLDALDESAGKRLFAAYGIPVPGGSTVQSASAGGGGCRRSGLPGGHEGFRRRRAAQDRRRSGDTGHFRRDRGARRLPHPGSSGRGGPRATLDGVLVEHQVQGKREFVVGLMRDHLFGPVVMFGLGGIFTEALHDVAFAVIPLSEEDVEELLDAIEAKVLLGPFRGSPAVDRAALRARDPGGRSDRPGPSRDPGDRHQPASVRWRRAGGRRCADRAGRACSGVDPPARRPVPSWTLWLPRAAWSWSARPRTRASGAGCWWPISGWAVFPGSIYLVNPKGGTILGLPVHP